MWCNWSIHLRSERDLRKYHDDHHYSLWLPAFGFCRYRYIYIYIYVRIINIAVVVTGITACAFRETCFTRNASVLHGSKFDAGPSSCCNDSWSDIQQSVFFKQPKWSIIDHEIIDRQTDSAGGFLSKAISKVPAWHSANVKPRTVFWRLVEGGSSWCRDQR